tara:strand:+ start:7814 stop:9193 length:1380 start_codon:yes stop_codon:yes gene_type:complete
MSYYIESNGEAIIIDPLREIEPYISRAKKTNAKIKYIFETHFHADFISGHLPLSEHTGAPIVFGPLAKPKFDCMILNDSEELNIGNLKIVALHTPGHTMESTCYLLKDGNGKNHSLFTGDTLFLGDVGRPDLAQKSKNRFSEKYLARLLYKSLRDKIFPLEDNIIIYPSHGFGSACGKKISKKTMALLGDEKKTNYALNPDISENEFVNELVTGLEKPPKYFPSNVKMNIEGCQKTSKVIANGLNPLSVDEFENLCKSRDVIILDVRDKNEFASGHIPNSLFIGIDGMFAPWAGTVIQEISTPLLLIIPKGREKETIKRLARVGFDNTLGYLKGGFTSWKDAGKKIDYINTISPNKFEEKSKKKSLRVYDVRKPFEFNTSHLKNSINIPLNNLNKKIKESEKENELFLHCQTGYRSMIASSLLKIKGYKNVNDINGGFVALKSYGIKTFSSKNLVNQNS